MSQSNAAVPRADLGFATLSLSCFSESTYGKKE
jgi:hypothetical protein